MTRYELSTSGDFLELGVATGDGSIEFIRHLQPGSRYLGVDLWAGDGAGVDRHGDDEYLRACVRISEAASSAGIFWSVWRRSFADALRECQEHGLLFDHVHVDGYAHAGSIGADGLTSWLELVRAGGVLSVHDYSYAWPVQKAMIDRFARGMGVCRCGVTTGPEDFPSWWMIKERA